MNSAQLSLLDHALAGRYAIERELGQGGMATVYLADDLKHRRKVALKILRPELAAFLGTDRFTREIGIAAGLNHPHILPLFDSGEIAGNRRLLWFTMPYVQGESLRQRLRRERQLPVEDAVRITRQVALALDYAHTHGLIHRDIKPENILLHEGEAVVTDFGIALGRDRGATGQGDGAESRLTGTGITLGTPEYMSPEQAAGERGLDGRSDIYSLGCVCYELLAGDPPFTGRSPREVLAKRFTDRVPRVRRLRPAVPPAIEQALVKAMASRPEDRFATAAEFAAALGVASRRSGGDSPPTRSVAVLPFVNLSADPENEFFADGITEDVIAQLSKIRALKVISRASVMRFKKREHSLREVGAELEVATVLDGSVRRAGDRVRIVAQLIDVSSDRPLWAETYDRQLTDIFAIQSDVALQIASALKAGLTRDERSRIHREPTSNFQAYQLYLQGRYRYIQYTETDINKAIEYYRQAIAADPGFALARVGIAVAYAELAAGQGGGPVRPDVAYEEAKLAVEQALALDPDLGEAHSVLALLKFAHDFDWAGAEEQFKLALELSPGSADIYDHYGWLCSALGRFDDAMALVKRAQELDPLAHRSDVANTLLRAGRFQEALEAARRAVEFEPHHGRSRSTVGWAYLKNGMVDEGLAELEEAVRLVPGNTLYLAQLGEAYGLVGRQERAREVLERLEQRAQTGYVSPYHLAYVYTGLGEADRALDFLELAYQGRAGSVYGIKGSFLFTSLREHPRFKALLRTMNLD